LKPEAKINSPSDQAGPARLAARLLGPACAIVLTAIAGCATAPVTTPSPEPAAKLTAVVFSTLDGWTSDRHADALSAFRKSCKALLAHSPDTTLGGLGAVRARDWQAPCRALAGETVVGDPAARRFFETWFRPYAVSGGGLFTGYYEPELRGALRPGGKYTIPLYGRPDDLVTATLGNFDPALAGKTITGRLQGGRLTPYPPRSAIESGALKGRARPVVWVDSAVDAFFLHIQGSGRVRLADGRVMRIGFAGHNGRVYRSIGRALIRRGAIPRGRVSMQTIRAWLAANPAEGARLMASNPRFVFFRRLEGPGPVGAQGVPLTPGRSLAVDRRYIPLGAPLWVRTLDPLRDNQLFQKLMIAQDTGGAIRGPVRGDIFFGHGPRAARLAGIMNRRGRYYLLLPRGAFPGS
jgi:membrane-bound lytic murein transglycosylase A